MDKAIKSVPSELHPLLKNLYPLPWNYAARVCEDLWHQGIEISPKRVYQAAYQSYNGEHAALILESIARDAVAARQANADLAYKIEKITRSEEPSNGGKGTELGEEPPLTRE